MKPKVRLPDAYEYSRMMKAKGKLNTVCEEARCPNKGECWARGTATFMILGDKCSRNCKYCSVGNGVSVVDSDEPRKVAVSVKELGLKYVVITSVTRDDLPDQGAGQFVKVVNVIKDCKVELLIPDLKGDNLKKVVEAKPSVIGHNMEVVKELFEHIRPQGNYGVSLDVLRKIKELDPSIKTKSGIMVGLGETKEQIISLMDDLVKNKVDIMTIGQYLRPGKEQVEVVKYYSDEEFEEFRKIGEEKGLKMLSGKLVRSSYHANEIY